MRQGLVVALLVAAMLAGGVRQVMRQAGAPPAVTVGRLPVAVAIDAQTQRVFVANSQDDTVSVLDTASGSLRATVAVGAGPLAVAIDEESARTFVLDTAGHSVSVLDARSGALVRTTPLGLGGGPAAVAVDRRSNRVFVLEQETYAAPGGMDVLDARTGALLRRVALPSWLNPLYPGTVAVDERTARVFVLTGEGNPAHLDLLDARSGSLLRTMPLAGAPFAIVVDEQTGRVFLPDAVSEVVTMLDARTGTRLRTVPLASVAYTFAYQLESVALDAQHAQVYVAGRAGLSVLDARRGSLVRTIPLGGAPIGVAVTSQPERVLVLEQDSAGAGSVSMLDARTDRVVATTAVGMVSAAMAVDSGTDRLFVVNAGGEPRTRGLGATVPAWLAALLPWRLQRPGAQVTDGSVSLLSVRG